MRATITREVLREQTYESRERNVLQELDRQLNMQFGIERCDPLDHFIDLKPDGDNTRFLLEGPDADRFAVTLGRVFPFLISPRSLIEQCAEMKDATVGDLVRLILEKVGA